jgi:hypothetical protein
MMWEGIVAPYSGKQQEPATNERKSKRRLPPPYKMLGQKW